jgi:hypothetical protein
VTSALTRRTRWLLLAGAVLVALLVNVAWVAFGPGDGGDRTRIESAVRKAWDASGTAPRTVACSQSDASWTCVIESARGDTVRCPVGDASVVLKNTAAALQASCRVE